MSDHYTTLLCYCLGFGAITVAAHFFVRNPALAILAALIVCVAAVGVLGWMQRAESAFWLIGVAVVSFYAVGIVLVVSLVCLVVRRAFPKSKNGDTTRAGQKSRSASDGP